MSFAVSASATERGIAARRAARPPLIEGSPETRKLSLYELARIERQRDMKAAVWFSRANYALDLLQRLEMNTEALPFRQTMQRIIRRICKATGTPEALVRGEGRNRKLIRIRYACIYWCRRLTGQSLPMIGRQFGDRDHTTILYAVRDYPKRRAIEGRQLRPLCASTAFAPFSRKDRA